MIALTLLPKPGICLNFDMTTTEILNFIWAIVRTTCSQPTITGTEWQNLPQNHIRRITGSMRRRVEAIIRARGGYIRY
jgi:hypothetical protein